MASLKTFFLNINVFESSTTSNTTLDPQQRRIYIIASRIYFIILISVLTIVGIVSSVTHRTTIVTVQNPTINQFIDLPQDKKCPCSKIAFRYEEFMLINASFHQVCSSDFISDRWIKTISSGSNSTYYSSEDFRSYGSAQFQALAGLCRLSVTFVQKQIDSYMSNSLISSQVLSESLLLSLIDASIAELQRTLLNDFAAQLQLIQAMTLSNRLISGLQTNNIQVYENISNDLIRIGVYPMQYKKNHRFICDCSMDLDCGTVSIISNRFNGSTHFNFGNDSIWMKVPGIVSGCLPVNSILLSTLECFYNQTCVDQLITFFSTTEKFTAMASNESSRYDLNSTVQTIIDELMIEQWSNILSYNTYYFQCAPALCTYAKLERNSIIFILTQLISILGGLTILLGFIIPIPIRSTQRSQASEQSSPTTCK